MTATATKKKTGSRKAGGSKKKDSEPAKTTGKIQYPEVSVELRSGDEALTADEAKILLGYKTPGEGDNFGTDFLFRDLEKKKVKLTNNPTNRPFRLSLAKKYMLEFLRRKWVLNGETIVADRLGHIQSGQHRLVGMILAEQERQKHPIYWEEHYGWKGPITAEFLLVTGISEKKEVADTLDLGQKRSLGDVVYRRHEFGKNVTDKSARKLANILSGAIRLVWIRTGGMQVSDAKHFPHSEALAFLEKHPKIKDAADFIFNEEGGSGADGRKISSLISMSYAAAFLYLAAAAKTDPEKDKVDLSLWDKACEFWTVFASGAGLAEDDPILTLSKALRRREAGSGKDRDIICGMVVKAWNAWVDGKKLTSKEIKIKESNVDGKRELAEFPRIGGLDMEREESALEEVEGWKINDVVFVQDTNVGAWKGRIIAFQDRDYVEVRGDDDGEIYIIPITDLSSEEPAQTEETAEAAA